MEAAGWAIALVWGYARYQDVVDWADEILLKTDAPNAEIVELSLARNTNEVLERLNGIAESIGQWEAIIEFLKRFACLQTMDPKDALILAEHLSIESMADDAPADFKVFQRHRSFINLALDGWEEDPAEQVELFLQDVRAIANTVS